MAIKQNPAALPTPTAAQVRHHLAIIIDLTHDVNRAMRNGRSELATIRYRRNQAITTAMADGLTEAQIVEAVDEYFANQN